MQRVEHWTCDQFVAGSNPTRGNAAWQPWASCSHLCASVTKQYNLVPAKGRWCFAAGEVTAKCYGSLPPGGWLTVTCGLTACTPGSSLGPVLGYRVWESLYLYRYHTLWFNGHCPNYAGFASCCCLPPFALYLLPSVLWYYWLGIKKSIRPLKNEWWGAGMVICLKRGSNELLVIQLMPLPPYRLLLYWNSERLNLSGVSGVSLPRLFWKRGR